MARTTAHHGPTRANASSAPVAVPVRGTALLLIDVINDLAFDGSDTLVAQAESMAALLAHLKRRAAAAGVPTIYINDNFGQWRSDFRRTPADRETRMKSRGNGARDQLDKRSALGLEAVQVRTE